MSDTSKNIAKSVALKAAIDLTKDEFSVEGDLSAQVEKIITVSDKFYDYLLDGNIEAVSAVFDVEEKPYYNAKPGDVVRVNPSKYEPKCPKCGGKVYDNRDTAQGKQPLWKCGNKGNCDNGKGYPWASWDENEFANDELAFISKQSFVNTTGEEDPVF